MLQKIASEGTKSYWLCTLKTEKAVLTLSILRQRSPGVLPSSRSSDSVGHGTCCSGSAAGAGSQQSCKWQCLCSYGSWSSSWSQMPAFDNNNKNNKTTHESTLFCPILKYSEIIFVNWKGLAHWWWLSCGHLNYNITQQHITFHILWLQGRHAKLWLICKAHDMRHGNGLAFLWWLALALTLAASKLTASGVAMR